MKNRFECTRIYSWLVTICFLILLCGCSKTEKKTAADVDIQVSRSDQRSIYIQIAPMNQKIVWDWSNVIKDETGKVFWYEASAEGERNVRCAGIDEDIEFDAFSEPGVRYVYYTTDEDESSEESYQDVVLIVCTGLPVIQIDTNVHVSEIKDEYLPGTMQIYYPDGRIYDSSDDSKEESFMIRARGNATKGQPKEPYKLKLPEKRNLLDLSDRSNQDRNWVLLANYADKTLLRAQTGFYVAGLFNDLKGNEKLYVPSAIPVDVVINGRYWGNYTLSDSVRASKDRVHINKKDSNPGGIGYLVERDNWYKSEEKWFEDGRGNGYSFKYPDEDDPNMDTYVNYMEQYVKEFEDSLYNPESEEWIQYIDIESFARWFLIQNLLANKDPNYYFYKESSSDKSKLKMGPVWDFDWSIGIGFMEEEDRPVSADYWVGTRWCFEELLKREEFVAELQKQWRRLNEEYPNLEKTICEKMREYEAEIHLSRQANYIMWPTMNLLVMSGGKPMGSYEAELECDMEFLHNRVIWLDEQIESLPESFLDDN